MLQRNPTYSLSGQTLRRMSDGRPSASLRRQSSYHPRASAGAHPVEICPTYPGGSAGSGSDRRILATDVAKLRRLPDIVRDHLGGNQSSCCDRQPVAPLFHSMITSQAMKTWTSRGRYSGSSTMAFRPIRAQGGSIQLPGCLPRARIFAHPDPAATYSLSGQTPRRMSA